MGCVRDTPHRKKRKKSKHGMCMRNFPDKNKANMGCVRETPQKEKRKRKKEKK